MNEERSTFVTVVAWLFIVGAGFSTLISLMQNVMFHVMFKREEFSQATQNMPASAAFMFENMQVFVFLFLFICIGMLVSSIGLLKRKNWARLIFIAGLSFGVIWSIGGIVFQMFFFSSIQEIPHSAQSEEFEIMQSIIQWFTATFSIVIAGVFIWIIRRLLTDTVKREFNAIESSSIK